jgi:hypothetical protein
MNFRKGFIFLIIGLTLLGITLTVAAQATPQTGSANITWPPPVYVLRGAFIVRGSANLSNMTNWFLEYRPLTSDPSEPWQPVTLPSRTAVQESILGVWDTAGVEDGLYVLRLTVNQSGNRRQQFEVSPLRVENNPPPFAVTEQAAQGTSTPPTLQPTPTAFSLNPTVTAIRNANVRQGDSTQYPVISTLSQGQSAPVIALSSLGTGWFYIQLDNGIRGWIAPSVVETNGNFAGLPRIEPPPPPVTPTPVPTATPASAVNLVVGNFSWNPPSPNCAQTFNVFIDVANLGSVTTPPAFLTVYDLRRADGTQQGSNTVTVPSLLPGQTLNIGPIPLTISTWYNEEHVLRMVVDSNNAIFEFNESDNSRDAIYFLNKAGCP